jgi:hypothetical protein
MFSAIFLAISAASRSEVVSASTNILISLPALRAYALLTHEKLCTNDSISCTLFKYSSITSLLAHGLTELIASATCTIAASSEIENCSQ